MNNKGVYAFVGIMIGLLIIITAIAISPVLQAQVSQARTDLNCSSGSLTASETATCIVVDWLFFLFVGLALMVGIGYVVIKKLLTANAGVQ